ncbi:hypothetical protein SDC9_98127 [bioreactor metagenome]|uniref:Uncharacterized protein n=1 Tax=bioreactor metagenome TaxID=1076179 RepID=A0A645ADX8_9ZZZZ
MRGLEHDARDRVVDAAACAGDLRARCVDDLFLRVVHQHHAGVHALADHRARRNGAVGVEQLHPVVVHDACAFGVVLAQPHHGAATVQRQHHQVVAVGAVDAPLLVRRDEVQRNLRVAVGLLAFHFVQRLQMHRWAIAHQTFAEVAHPRMVLIELLATGERAPWDQLMHVGVARVVADLFAFQPRPCWRADDLARLRLDVAEADLLVFAVQRQVHVITARLLAQCIPRLAGHMAVGFGRQHHHHFGGVDVADDARHALGHALFAYAAIEIAELPHFRLGVPADPLATIADLFHQRAQCGEALVHVRIVALDHRDLRCGLAGDKVALTALPVLHAIRLRHFGCGVVHDGREHHFLFHAQVAHAQLAEGLGEALVDLPIAARLPCRIDRSGQWVDERMHVAGVEVVLLIPGGCGQHDVGIQTGRAHAEVQRDQQIQLAFRPVGMPVHLLGLGILRPQILALHAVRGAQQVLEEVLMPLAR